MIERIRKAMDERDRGFSLVELLVVIIIIGILAAIAIPVFLNQRKKGIDASLKSDLKSMATRQETYISDFPAAPGLTVVATTPGGSTSVGIGQTFQASPGNVIAVGINNGGYCIRGYNTGASKAVDYANALKFDSKAGGLNTTGGSC